MAYFDELNDIINKVVELISKDEELMKLIAYPDETKTDITNLMNKNIFLMPRGADAVKDEKTFLNIYMGSTYRYEENSGFREACLTFDIFSHLNLWLMPKSNTIRPYLISSKIDKIFNDNFDKQVRQISNNAPLFYSWKPYRYGEYFYGYKLEYYISLNSNVRNKHNG